MPLQFESITHGVIAFGFFNIESDLLLLENNFIFADEFCRNIIALTENLSEKGFSDRWNVWQIEKGPEMGDLMGAMHGIHRSGFFGALYQKYPFPRRKMDFKQKTEGWKTQAEVKAILQDYGRLTVLPVHVEPVEERVHIGDYAFTKRVFQALINYVWEGGYPKWKDGKRPEYVTEMAECIKEKKLSLFSDALLKGYSV
ncbi:hypothetical protein DSCOOX_50140 [Desulfosarcina ovata subsp. ovata]|uniref:Uncharacterized protein n=1 Tax=Desulfosarcina ovata subsp. ovata TaxID=2752305 RepID=A0A5K8AJI3_9BACT|nr:hypothetical protein DSCOOX_50140 [Desulfosarcina ovata subsp. ovata]